mgnify:CR=1 FL=1|jgi:hypothetical protein|tara:strand:+ start:840 stop:1022 length:183 start_codon:yes stop_codon:yes gene_type:complete
MFRQTDGDMAPINPRKIFNTSGASNGVTEYSTLVGEVKPVYGVRTKKQKAGESRRNQSQK